MLQNTANIKYTKYDISNLRIIQIAALNDNYIYVIHDVISQQTAVIDPADADLVLEMLAATGWQLTHIFNTHHHFDHVGGNEVLKRVTGCDVYGYHADAQRIPCINRMLEADSDVIWANQPLRIIFLPGHTTGHIAYLFVEHNILFCGDVLFMMGCGRIFEGTVKQAYESINKIKCLDDMTLIFCAHEYTLTNGRFALSVETDNKLLQARVQLVEQQYKKGVFTVPASLAVEKETNPFLRTDSEAIKFNLSMPDADNLDIFAKLRKMRDVFSG